MSIDARPDLTSGVISGLGWLYLLLFAMNSAWTVRAFRREEETRFLRGSHVPSAAIWALYSSVLLMISMAHFTGASSAQSFMIRMPETVLGLPIKVWINSLANPVMFFSLSVTVFILMILLRKWLVRPTVAWVLLNLSILFIAFSITDFDFRQIVGKPDNVPIVGMLYLVGFFTWLYFKRSVENDTRRAEGRQLVEEEGNEKILVWPDLVYTELICMIALTALLVVWGIALPAPLEEAASAAKTPNPSKAPWYFLGLQEMLVYFDPWLAGVLFPSVIVVGLMALPYIDFNKKGNGYYTFNERKFAVSTFMFGFIPLWVAMIILGTFLRGPNWNFFGIYEQWDVHKVVDQTNVDLSDYFWINLLRERLGFDVMKPTYSNDAGIVTKLWTIALRESPGFILIALYFIVLPPLMAATVFRKYFVQMGFVRYMVFAMLLLLMAALPIKMILRWSVNLKYLVHIDEFFLNI